MQANDVRVVWVMACLGLASAALGRNDPKVQWGHQLITPTPDTIRAAGVDSHDGIYFAVSVKHKDASKRTVFKDTTLYKYNRQGAALWQKQLEGCSVGDFAADNHGNIYAFGHMRKTSEQQTKGGYDAFVIKLDRAGDQQWQWQLGTPEHDVLTGLAFDRAGNLYVTGYTYGDFSQPNQGGADMFLAAYDPLRTLLWRKQLGTATDDRAMDIQIDAQGDLYICGNTSEKLGEQSFGQSDFIVAKYSNAGKSHWLRQYGTPAHDTIMCMAIGELGHLYLGCRTNGKLGVRRANRRDLDSCLIRITETGEVVWKRQFGSLNWDGTWDMARFHDGSGDILISGCQYPTGICQAFNRRYTPQGRRIWTKVFREKGPRGGTCGRVCTIDSDNNCYHGGITSANTFGVNNGTPNVYIVRFNGTTDKP